MDSGLKYAFEWRSCMDWESDTKTLIRLKTLRNKIHHKQFWLDFCKADGISIILYQLRNLHKCYKIRAIFLFLAAASNYDELDTFIKKCTINTEIFLCLIEYINWEQKQFYKSAALMAQGRLVKYKDDDYYLYRKAEYIFAKNKALVPFKTIVDCLDVNNGTADYEAFQLLMGVMQSCENLVELLSFVSCILKNNVLRKKYMQHDFKPQYPHFNQAKAHLFISRVSLFEKFAMEIISFCDKFSLVQLP